MPHMARRKSGTEGLQKSILKKMDLFLPEEGAGEEDVGHGQAAAAAHVGPGLPLGYEGMPCALQVCLHVHCQSLAAEGGGE